MDFVDYRKVKQKAQNEPEIRKPQANRFHGDAYRSYIEEQIRDAEERGLFSNLPGIGKPLHFEENVYAGDKKMGYSLLKSNGLAPLEVELSKEIRGEREHAEAKIAKIKHRSKMLHSRRVPPFANEKRAFNVMVEKAASEYEDALRKLNRKILTLNVSTPPPMHQPLLEVEQLTKQFREDCPLFDTL